MIVVADTSPLNYLILIDQINVLSHLFGTLRIPQAVADELADEGAEKSVRDWIAKPPLWLQITQVSHARIEQVSARLDWGERAAIALAQQLGADLLLIDERMGRQVAAEENIPVAGLLAVLAEAVHLEWVTPAEAIAGLRQTTFRASPQLYKWLLDQQV